MNSGRSSFLSALSGALVVAVVFGALALGGVFDGDDDDGAPTSRVAVPRSADSDAGAKDATPSAGVIATDVADLYEDVRPGVVSVETRTQANPLTGGGGGGSGSGFILDREGYILTNDHVVEGANRVQVRFAEGDPVRARVVGKDPSSDLAMLKIDPAGLKLRPLTLGDSQRLRVGEPAIALGSPFGLEGTLTTGVVSALDRSITAPNSFPIDSVIQTDAAINPGNSGGPLMDVRGRVIGINAQIATSSRSNSGVGFAIPIATAKQVLPDLRAGKKITRPYLGVSTGDPETGGGALVGSVVAGGPADKAGIEVEDRIVAIGGRTIAEADEVAARVTAYKPGDKVRIQVRRDGATRTVTATLGTRPTRAPGRSPQVP